MVDLMKTWTDAPADDTGMCTELADTADPAGIIVERLILATT